MSRTSATLSLLLLIACGDKEEGRPPTTSSDDTAGDTEGGSEDSGADSGTGDADDTGDCIDPSIWYADADDDGYGDVNVSTTSCVQPHYTVADATDCDDTEPSTHPEAFDPCGDGIAQDCDDVDPVCTGGTFDGDVSIRTVDGMEELCSTYDRIHGDLMIQDTSLGDLDELACLVEVSGSVFVNNNSGLDNLDGLANLRRVSWAISIYENGWPTLQGFPALEELGGYLYAQDCPSNGSLMDFGSLRTVGTDMWLSTSGAELVDLHSLESIGGDLWLTLYDGTSTLDLRSLEEVGGTLHLDTWPTDRLEALSIDLSSLTAPSGGLKLDLPGLDNVDFLSGLVSLGGDLYFMLPAVTDLSPLSQLESVGGLLWLDDLNHEITDFSGLSSLRSAGSISIVNSTSPTTLSGFEQLSEVTGDLYLSGMNRVTDLSGLSGLQRVGGSLDIWDMRGIRSLEGLGSLTEVGVLSLYRDSKLVNLVGMGPITHTISVQVDNCSKIETLAGLESLTSLDAHLVLHGNDVLTDLSAIDGIQSIGSDVQITSNWALEDAEVERWLAEVGVENIGGTVTYY